MVSTVKCAGSLLWLLLAAAWLRTMDARHMLEVRETKSLSRVGHFEGMRHRVACKDGPILGFTAYWGELNEDVGCEEPVVVGLRLHCNGKFLGQHNKENALPSTSIFGLKTNNSATVLCSPEGMSSVHWRKAKFPKPESPEDDDMHTTNLYVGGILVECMAKPGAPSGARSEVMDIEDTEGGQSAGLAKYDNHVACPDEGDMLHALDMWYARGQWFGFEVLQCGTSADSNHAVDSRPP